MHLPTTLRDVVNRLRGPGGCAWDAAQTPASLGPFLLEEASEVLDALAAERWEAVAEELGDTLFVLTSITHAAAHEGRFPLHRPEQLAIDKMVRRHPHVFADADAPPDWEALKRAEGKPAGASALDGVPRALPALPRAQAITHAAARVGFDWPDVDGVWAKLDEEAAEVRAATSTAEREAELGDLLFTVVNLARHLDVDADAALRGATARFEARFRAVEGMALADGHAVSTLSADTLDALWRRAKQLAR